jgi:hypothetical protein
VKVILSPEVIEDVKADLRLLLPDVKSSHRIEAVARGFRWATNAAMRAALISGPVEREVDVGAFVSYLSGQGFAGESSPLVQSVLRVQIRTVMEQHPGLTHFGFGVYNERRLSVDDWCTRMAESREEMLGEHAVYEFQRACQYLACLDRIKTLNRQCTSYNLKHAAERFHDRKQETTGKNDRTYVSNGMLITAAYHLGFSVASVVHRSANAFLNISNRSFKEVDSVPMPLPQPESGQYFRVLGHNQGKFFYVAAGSERLVSLRAGAHSPAQLVKLAPLNYWITRFPPRDRRSPFDTMAAIGSLFRLADIAGIYQPPE